MIRYIDDSLIMTATPNEAVYVIDGDVQATWLTGEAKYFSESFPKIHKQLKRLSYNKLLKAGNCYLLEDEGYKIAVLITKKDRRTTSMERQKYFQSAVLDLFSKVPSDVFIYSPVLGRVEDDWVDYDLTISRLINQEKLARCWFVYLMKGYGDVVNK